MIFKHSNLVDLINAWKLENARKYRSRFANRLNTAGMCRLKRDVVCKLVIIGT